jgi:hypothetical protein
MECQKARIEELEQTLALTKITYKETMLNLSKISEEVKYFLIYVLKYKFVLTVHQFLDTQQAKD